jgi:predicted aminopeptidase
MRYRTLASLTGAGAAFAAFFVYWIVRIANARTFANIHNCPACHSTDTSPSLTAQPLDWIFRMFRCSPYRCQVCSKRYFRGEIRETAKRVLL